jgi:hypothetical protein
LEDDWLTEESEPAPLTLRFSPTAWAKLLYFRDRSDNEIGGFGITHPDDLLFVKEFVTVRQEVTCVSVRFDDEAVADLFDQQVDLGRKPEHFARLWCHTHPDMSPVPSTVDEETFARVFGTCEWAVMFILARDNRAYCRLGFNVGPGGQVQIPTAVDFAEEFGPSDHEAWETEYCANVRAVDCLSTRPANEANTAESRVQDGVLLYDFLEEFESMEPAQRRLILDELAERPELWDEESEVMFL